MSIKPARFKKPLNLPVIVISPFVVILFSGIKDVLKGKETLAHWLLEIPFTILIFASLNCAGLLGARFERGGDRSSLWRRWSDLVGCLGITYLYGTIIHFLPDAPLPIAGLAAFMSAVAMLVGYKWSEEKRQVALKAASPELP